MSSLKRTFSCFGWGLPLALMLFSMIAISPAYGGITVGGGLGDWGIGQTGSGGTSQTILGGSPNVHNTYQDGAAYNSYAGLVEKKQGVYEFGGNTVYYQAEDSNDSNFNYQVGPQWGGQAFDAEWLGVTFDSTAQRLSIAISSGQRSDYIDGGVYGGTGAKLFEPGDIRIDVLDMGGNVLRTYGVETGGKDVGGVDTATRDSGTIPTNWTEGATGAGFTFDSYFDASSVVAMTGAAAGTVWQTVNPLGDPTMSQNVSTTDDNWAWGYNYHAPTQLASKTGATLVTTADFIYDQSSNLGNHAYLELSLDANALNIGVGNRVQVYWAPSCANDELLLTVRVPAGSPPPVPEPCTLLCWSGLLLGGAFLSRRRKQRVV